MKIDINQQKIVQLKELEIGDVFIWNKSVHIVIKKEHTINLGTQEKNRIRPTTKVKPVDKEDITLIIED